MRSRIAQFLRANRDDINGMVRECDLASPSATEITEIGRFISRNWQMSRRTFGQRLSPSTTQVWKWNVDRYPPYPTMEEAWYAEPEGFQWGNIHTHPNFPGNNKLSSGDLAYLADGRVELMLVATRAPDGKLKVFAQWDGSEEDGEVFDLFPGAHFIFRAYMFLRTGHYLKDWEIILLDEDGDGKITIKDAMRAAQEGR